MGSIGYVDRGEGGLQLVYCCSPRDKTAGLHLGEQTQKGFSGRHGLWFSRACLLELGAGIQ